VSLGGYGPRSSDRTQSNRATLTSRWRAAWWGGGCVGVLVAGMTRRACCVWLSDEKGLDGLLSWPSEAPLCVCVCVHVTRTCRNESRVRFGASSIAGHDHPIRGPHCLGPAVRSTHKPRGVAVIDPIDRNKMWCDSQSLVIGAGRRPLPHRLMSPTARPTPPRTSRLSRTWMTRKRKGGVLWSPPLLASVKGGRKKEGRTAPQCMGRRLGLPSGRGKRARPKQGEHGNDKQQQQQQ
jgi:hypothetical protein